MRKVILISGLFLLMAFFSQCVKKAKSEKLSGLWQLQSMEKFDTVKNVYAPWRAGMKGLLLYGNHQNVALHLFDSAFQNFDSTYANFDSTITLEALKNNTRSYYYMGTYKILNDSTIAHTRLSHSNPKDFNVTVKRQFFFKKDTLIMTPVEKSNAHLRLKWVQIYE